MVKISEDDLHSIHIEAMHQTPKDRRQREQRLIRHEFRTGNTKIFAPGTKVVDIEAVIIQGDLDNEREDDGYFNDAYVGGEATRRVLALKRSYH